MLTVKFKTARQVTKRFVFKKTGKPKGKDKLTVRVSPNEI